MPDFESLPTVLTLPGMEDVQIARDIPYAEENADLRYDLYRPHEHGHPLPAVILVSGNILGDEVLRTKHWAGFETAGRLLAASGLAAITFDKHAWQDVAGLQRTSAEVEQLIDSVRGNPAEYGLDPEKLALWVFSAGPPHGLRRALAQAPRYLRCLAVYYGVMDLRPQAADAEEETALAEFSPITYLAAAAAIMPPLLLARAGLDNPRLNDTLDAFVAEALRLNAPLELINHSKGQHAFELLDDVPLTRYILLRTLEFFSQYLWESESVVTFENRP